MVSSEWQMWTPNGNRGVSVVGIAARETRGKTESPGNGAATP
jgi:hypothetical protein